MNKLVQQTEPYQFPSLMHDLDMETYKQIDALNSHSAGTLMDVSPYHFWYEKEHPEPPSAPMKLGTLVHDLILEPDKIEYRVLPKDGNKKTSLGKRLLVESYCRWMEMDPPFSEQKAEGKILDEQLKVLESAFAMTPWYTISEDDIGMGERIRENLFKNSETAQALFADGKPEVTALWEDQGCKKKARCDWVPEGHEIILDLKSIDCASYDDCYRAVQRFGYDYQGAWYREAGRATGLGDRAFVLLFFERKAPFQSRFFHFLREDLDKAAHRNQIASARYVKAKQSGRWESYPDTIEPMPMPQYRY